MCFWAYQVQTGSPHLASSARHSTWVSLWTRTVLCRWYAGGWEVVCGHRPPVCWMSDRHTALLLLTVHLPQLHVFFHFLVLHLLWFHWSPASWTLCFSGDLPLTYIMFIYVYLLANKLFVPLWQPASAFLYACAYCVLRRINMMMMMMIDWMSQDSQRSSWWRHICDISTNMSA